MNSYGLRPFKNPIESWDFSKSTIQKRNFKTSDSGLPAYVIQQHEFADQKQIGLLKVCRFGYGLKLESVRRQT
jgi:hypothetical protein